ncbi:sulfatase [Tenacibaculum sp. UWU-22]|uniref:sulfatase n=1 Tax=Tenacibaculum sp. UWU-22 TaxID=3234187 RepID=UPI0034DB6215
MNKKTFSSFYLILLLSIVSLLEVSCKSKKVYENSAKQSDAPPNIIVFLVDDMGPMDTSVPFISDTLNNTKKYPLNNFYRTPHMDELAKQGVRFTNFYAHSVCSPSRTTIMTGQNSARHHVTTWIDPFNNNKGKYGPPDWNWKGLTSKSITIPRLLHTVGYQTIHIGKGHFGPKGSEGANPLNLGFDVNIGGGYMGRPGSYYGKDGYGNIKGDKGRAVPGLEKYYDKDVFLTEALTLEANKAITEAHQQGKPFYLYMSHYAVHAPFQSDPRFANHYKNSGKSKKAIAYATLVEGMDKSLGDIIAHVKEMGVGNNTLILFLGDNGSDAPLPIKNNYSSSAPLKGKKGNHWEGGIRVPFMAAWVTPDSESPNQKMYPIAVGAIQTELGDITDIFPTLCKVAGAPIPSNYTYDGASLLTQFRGLYNDTRQNIFINHFPHEHRSNYFTSMVNGHWKVVYHYPIKTNQPQYELFDLSTDPFETTNLAAEKPKKLLENMKLLEKQLTIEGAQYPVKNGQELRLIMPN